MWPSHSALGYKNYERRICGDYFDIPMSDALLNIYWLSPVPDEGSVTTPAGLMG